jgi:hypothetical protein
MMIRYTLEMEGHDEGLNIESLKETLDKPLMRKVTAYKINRNGIILLATDLSTDRLLELLYTIKNQGTSIRHISIRFGWDIIFPL